MFPAEPACTTAWRDTGPDAETFERASNADLKPQYLDNTLAFMFETQLVVRPTEFAMKTMVLQHEYFECWQGLKKTIRTTRNPQRMNDDPLTRRSWVQSANDPTCGFPLQNLPYGVFRHQGQARIGVAIGDQILNLHACAADAAFRDLPRSLLTACEATVLNPLMALGPSSWALLRQVVTALLDERSPAREHLLVPMADVEMLLPARIGDYTDFYASIHHATRVGKLFRPESPLLPNYKYLPIGYNGRASSVVVSGTPIRRPSGQTRSASADPVYGPTQQLDFELEVGFFVGTGNRLGDTIPVAEAEQHIFGLCLV